MKSTVKTPLCFLLALALPLLLTSPALARPQNVAPIDTYRAAFNAIDSGTSPLNMSTVSNGPNTALNLVLRGMMMAQPGNDYSFDELAAFIEQHPDWPNLKGIISIAEQKIPSNATADQVTNWFTAHPAVSHAGFYRQIDAMNATGQSDRATVLVRTRWVERDFSGDELIVYGNRFASVLRAADHNARLDRLLWENDITDARRMYNFVQPDVRALAEARLALANQLNNADSYVARVPSQWQTEPGLLYEQLRWQRKNQNDKAAVEILLNAPDDLGKPEAWWAERAIIIRRVMDLRDYNLAYRLAAKHGISEGFDYAQAEFMAGWLALRFLNDADRARQHFQNLYENGTTPITRARGAYWLGQALEALNDKSGAEQAYETAASLNTTFYGQLAATRLYAAPSMVAAPEPKIPDSIRRSFFSRDIVQAIQQLNRIGATDRARQFFKAATDYATQRSEFFLLTDLAYEMRRPDWAITAAKAANQKNMIMASSAYPILSMRLPTPPEAAFTLALIRQESQFNASVQSPAGAKGLMQLMPGTAKQVAKREGIRYSEGALTQPDYNVRLGTAFVQQLIDRFDGSYILTLAAYNAGPGRVRQWIEQYGDPRTPNVNPVDWIEMIPIYETRNYVQRIMENFQIYKARLNGGEAPLTILQDLRR